MKRLCFSAGFADGLGWLIPLPESAIRARTGFGSGSRVVKNQATRAGCVVGENSEPVGGRGSGVYVAVTPSAMYARSGLDVSRRHAAGRISTGSSRRSPLRTLRCDRAAFPSRPYRSYPLASCGDVCFVVANPSRLHPTPGRTAPTRLVSSLLLSPLLARHSSWSRRSRTAGGLLLPPPPAQRHTP